VGRLKCLEHLSNGHLLKKAEWLAVAKKNICAVALFLLASSDIAPRILDHIRPHHVTVKDTVNCGSDVASPIEVTSVWVHTSY
jgi:hypothetical protein